MPSSQIVLGFDVSLNRIGIAIGNLITRDARPLLQINSRDKNQRFTEIARLVSDWEPETLIVGVPSHPDGAPLPNTAFCQRFANQLRGRFLKPVIELNENFTSVAARERGGWAFKALLGSASTDADESIDAWAAVEMLEQYLNG
jgi:putative Holliday junction resolvase